MKILLLGKSGQLGWELQRALAPLGNVVAPGRESAADLSTPEALPHLLDTYQPQVIVNAAAYTAVDRAEMPQEQDLCMRVNARAPLALAHWAAQHQALLVHYSSDYVYDGSGTHARHEDTPLNPLSVYGRSKAQADEAIADSGCRYLILRTSWVYGARGGNFAKTMLRLGAERDSLRVINDQWGAPTGADLLADLSAHMIRMAWGRPELDGLYHAAALGTTSWHGYAQHVLDYAHRRGHTLKAGPNQVYPVSTAEYPTSAARPLNSRLDTGKLRRAFDLHLPMWQSGVERMLEEIL